jgi:hypothetical protein
LQDWQDVRGDEAIQFAPVKIPEKVEKPPEAPQWLDDVFGWLGDLFQPMAKGLGEGWPMVKWGLIAIGVLLLGLLLWRLLAPVLALRGGEQDEPLDDWVPDRGEAMVLLDEADQLAAQGQFDQATHLLLRRSVGQIALARPAWLEPSSTAREIALLPALPDAARRAFGVIAERVERSLFALRSLDAADWQAARSAYADFALADLRAA